MSLKRKAEELNPGEFTLKTSPNLVEAQKVYPEVLKLPTDSSTETEYHHLFKKRMQTDGFCVVQVLEEAEVTALHNGFWAYLEKLGTGIDRKDPTTWDPLSSWPDQVHGIIKSFGVGHTEFMWRGRTNTKILKAWELAYGTKKLITSYDGACYYPAHRAFRHKEKKTAWWFHIDQSPKRRPFECWQSIVQLTDTTAPNSGGFVCIPQTHRVNFASIYPEEVTEASLSKNWFKIPRASPTVHAGKAIAVGVPGGSVVFWDSRLVHANSPPPSALLERVVLYICMKPASSLDGKRSIHTKRVNYFRNNRTTSHWPDKVTVNSDSVRFRSKSTLHPKQILTHLKPFRFDEREPKQALEQARLISRRVALPASASTLPSNSQIAK